VPTTPPNVDLAVLLPSWELALRAERKSPQTIKTYGDGVRQYLGWCAEQERPPDLSKSSVNGFVASLLDRGHAAATARARQLAVRRFAAWLVEEEEMAVDPLLGIKAPQLDSKVIEPLTEAQLRRCSRRAPGDARPPRRGHPAPDAGDRRTSR
jgi:site-specific recombinase XerD